MVSGKMGLDSTGMEIGWIWVITPFDQGVVRQRYQTDAGPRVTACVEVPKHNRVPKCAFADT